MAYPVQTPPGCSNSILLHMELKGSSASSSLMSDVDCFEQELWCFPACLRSDPFITKIKQILTVTTGSLSADIASRLRAVYLEGDWMKTASK